MLVYAATIFLSAFLLFQVQPLIAKFILPWFGGSAAVWSAALLFFQLVLLAGYFYAHCLIRYLKPKQQFVGALRAAGRQLGDAAHHSRFALEAARRRRSDARILLLLGATVGLPYLLLSATSPLLQAWYVRTRGRVPYRLFALSNFGIDAGAAQLSVRGRAAVEAGRRRRSRGRAGYVRVRGECAAVGWTSSSREETRTGVREPRRRPRSRLRSAVDRLSRLARPRCCWP